MEKLITVFTPTYNRAYCLSDSYEALKRQTSKNFEWLIIDDGSTDNTSALVQMWQKENLPFKIRYVKKENGGLQSGYVEALKHITTELCFCVDSDDYLCDDAIERVEAFWLRFGNMNVAGIFALDMFKDGTILGGKFEGLVDGDLIDLIDIDIRRKIKRSQSDRMLIIRTEIYKMASPAKRYENEKTINATYLHLQIAKKYKFLLLNQPICVVEYRSDGRSVPRNRIKDYIQNPNTYADWRLFKLSFDCLPIKEKVIQNLHYVVECLAAKREIIKPSPTKLITFFSIPFSFVLLYIIKIWMIFEAKDDNSNRS